MDINVVLLVLHVMLALGMVTLILLQKGKGAAEGATFGGGATSVFGASGSANFLSKTTAILATGFFINCLALAYLASHRDEPKSLVDALENKSSQQVVVPAQEAVDDTIPLPADTAAEDDVPPPATE